MAATSTTRRKFIRNPDRVEEVVVKAMDRLREQKGKNEFRAPISEIMEAMDKRLRSMPSRASVYRALERLEEKGVFKITRKGERGNYTYRFTGALTPSEAPSVTTPSAPPETRTERIVKVAQVSNDLQSLIEEDHNLDTQIEQMMDSLRARIASKKSTLAALEAQISSRKREAVPA